MDEISKGASCSAKDKTVINIALFGKTGHGKSASGNTLLNRQAFDTFNDFASGTKFCELQCTENDECILNVVDSPGLMDTDLSQDEILERIYCSMSLCPEGFNAVLLVFRYGSKFTEEEEGVFKLLELTFGEQFLRSVGIVVLTHGDTFDNDNEEKGEQYTFQTFMKEQKTKNGKFYSLIEKCNERVVILYNKGKQYEKKRQESRDQLLDLIKQIDKRYNNDLFKKTAMAREILAKELKLPNQLGFVQRYLSIIIQYLHKLQFSELNKKGIIIQIASPIAILIKKCSKFDKEFPTMGEFIKKLQDIQNNLTTLLPLEILKRLCALKNACSGQLWGYFAIAAGVVVIGGLAAIIIYKARKGLK